MKTKKSKHSDNKINMYYEQEFQLEQDRLNNVDKKKIKEREKRIKQMNKEKSKIEEKFDFDTINEDEFIQDDEQEISENNAEEITDMFSQLI